MKKIPDPKPITSLLKPARSCVIVSLAIETFVRST